jgi:16S rRNA (guanine527-N7)-methyltransferase
VTSRIAPDVLSQLEALVDRYGLSAEAVRPLGCLADALMNDPLAPTTVRDPVAVVNDHLADSLVSVDLPEVRGARRAVDIGAGAGLPGLPLAIALPACAFVLLEAAARKCAFLAAEVERCSIVNATVAQARAESWTEGLEAFDLATARAVAAPAVLVEYAAPLLAIGGVLVAWRGRRDSALEEAADIAADEVGMKPAGIFAVTPYESAEHRHLHLWSKVRKTPERFPRRPGVALKRPLGGRRLPSDRAQR